MLARIVLGKVDRLGDLDVRLERTLAGIENQQADQLSARSSQGVSDAEKR